MKYTCNVCKKKHDLITGVQVLKPNILDDQNIRVDLIMNKFYLVDKKFILTEAEFNMSVKEEDFSIHFIVWVRLDPNDFITKTQNLNGNEMKITGHIHDLIPMYLDDDKTMIELTYKFDQKKTDFPQINFLNKNSTIAKDKFNGVSLKKLIEFSQIIAHPNSPPIVEVY